MRLKILSFILLLMSSGCGDKKPSSSKQSTPSVPSRSEENRVEELVMEINSIKEMMTLLIKEGHANVDPMLLKKKEEKGAMEKKKVELLKSMPDKFSTFFSEINEENDSSNLSNIIIPPNFTSENIISSQLYKSFNELKAVEDEIKLLEEEIENLSSDKKNIASIETNVEALGFNEDSGVEDEIEEAEEIIGGFTSGNIPIPPAPPAPPAPPTSNDSPAPSTGGMDVLEGLKHLKKVTKEELEKAEDEKKKAALSRAPTIIDEIHAGCELRHVTDEEKARERRASETSNPVIPTLASALASKMEEIKRASSPDSDFDSDDDEGFDEDEEFIAESAKLDEELRTRKKEIAEDKMLTSAEKRALIAVTEFTINTRRKVLKKKKSKKERPNLQKKKPGEKGKNRGRKKKPKDKKNKQKVTKDNYSKEKDHKNNNLKGKNKN